MEKIKLDFEVTEFRKDYLKNSLERSSLFSTVFCQGEFLCYEVLSNQDVGKAQKVIESCFAICRHLNAAILYSSTYKANRDHNPLVEWDQDVVETEKGIYAFKGKYLSFMHFLDSLFLSISTELGAQEFQYPVLWKNDLFRRINYFRDFPQNILLVTGVKKDNPSLERVAENYDAINNFTTVEINGCFTESNVSLGTSICDSCYYVIRNSSLAVNGVYTAVGKCFRNEAPELTGLDRQCEFTMREVIGTGSSEYTLGIREQFIQYAISLLEFLKLEAVIETAQDPFFTNDANLKSLFQNSVNAKYELLAYLPYKDKKLAVGSINWHGDYFGKSFDVKMNDGSLMNSTCLAFGIERLALAFFSQYGYSEKNWPSEVRNAFMDYLKAVTHLRSNKYLSLAKSPVSSNQTGGEKVQLTDPVSPEIARRLLGIFSTIFDILPENPMDITKDSVKGWNSLNHIRLLLEINRQFELSIPQNQYTALYSDFCSIARYLENVK